MHTTILTLHKQGLGQRKIAKIMGVNRWTVRKIIERYSETGKELPAPYKRVSSNEAWHEAIVKLLENNLSIVRIFEELCVQGFKGSYSALSRYIRKNNIKVETCIRFHTAAGEEAQVDFGYVGKRYDTEGKLRKAYVFNMRLSYSRLDYYEIVFDQKVATWLKCHMNAFNFFGGVVATVKLDNLSSGVTIASFYEPICQKEYKRFADHYGFLLSPCRPNKPQEKGKIESGIKYVKNNFFAGRKFSSNEDMNRQLQQWVDKANGRIHGTTKVKPTELFDKEAQYLLPLPTIAFDLSSWHYRTVAKDCHISLDNNYYSVPAKYALKEVKVQLDSKLIKVYADEELIATHVRAKGQGVFTTNNSHYAIGKRQCPGFPEYDQKCEEQMIKIGGNCSMVLRRIQEEQSKQWHRTARGIISLRKLYSDEDIDKACQRALHYGVTSYSKIKKILDNHCYNLPLNEGGNYANVA